MLIEHELSIEAPADVVWDLTVDVEGWPALTPTITSVERLDDGPLRVGSQARVKQPAQRAAVWTVTRFDEGERFEWEAEVLGTTMVGRHVVTAEGPHSRNTLQIEMTGWSAPLLGALAGGRIRKAIATENEGFKRAAEGSAAR